MPKQFQSWMVMNMIKIFEDQRASKQFKGIGVSFFMKKYITIHQKLKKNRKNDEKTKNNQAH